MAKRVSYSKIAPKGTFIHAFMEHMAAQETSESYDFWCAVWTLASVIGRKVVVDRPRAPVFLNWYVVLVAESGVTRKSSAVRVARELAKELIDAEQFITTKITPQSLEFKMHQLTKTHGEASVAIAISELATFLGRENSMMTMPALLTDLYDCPATRRGGGTLYKGETIIENAFCSFLSASTPSWLMRAINPDVIEGGFTSRTMFIVSEQRKRKIAWPETDNDEQRRTEETLRIHLERIKGRADSVRRIELDKGALSAYRKWYNNRTEHHDPYRSSFESREDAHVLRLAACLAVNDGSWHVSNNHISKAISVIQEAKHDGASLFVGGNVQNKLTLGIDKIKEALVQAGIDGMKHMTLQQHVRYYMDAQRLQDVLEIMAELEMVQCYEMLVPGFKNKKSRYWRATNKILARDVTELVTTQLNPQL